MTATTAINGRFTLTNVPVGTNIPLVIQTGRWRRKITIPSVVCAATPTQLSPLQTSMPATEAQGEPTASNPKYVAWLVDESMLSDANMLAKAPPAKVEEWRALEKSLVEKQKSIRESLAKL